jgi:glucose-1-phosphate cytidylyltransferase
MKEPIPVVILCGGYGTRLAEQTEVRPKPMVEIGGQPILWHIMKHFSRYGFHEFYLALGYKGEHIKRYFLDFYSMGQNLTVSLESGDVHTIGQRAPEPWRVHLVDTGLDSLTGARLQALGPMLGSKSFMMTYGDSVGDVDLHKLLAFHRQHGDLVTLTAVRPPARYGALELDGQRIRSFKEKSAVHEGWINGGFFVVEPKALDYISGNIMWEHAPLERLAEEGHLFAHRHEGFWHCMDTLRDLRHLEAMWDSGAPPWKTWD